MISYKRRGSVEAFQRSFRLAAANVHPDRGGGRLLWDKLQKAKAVLDHFHGVAKNRGGA